MSGPRGEAGRGAARGWRRTHTCGELRLEHLGARVTLNGWIDARRDHGGIYFLDVRDRYGITQVVLSEELAEGFKLGPEWVVSVTGEVVDRDTKNVNPERPTGGIEVVAESIEVLAPSEVPPIDVSGEVEASVENRLRYRFLDLRRAPMQRNLEHRSRFVNAMRRAFDAEGFVDVETPVLTRATPEGARDYLVPSRVHPGAFYALPQSPQIFKQILMVAGLDRYYQVARCFRDEDLRADRQPEFTQLDMEMSFVEEEDVFRVWERVLAATFREALGEELATPFPRLTWAESMARFGTDKPDVRFGMELVDVSEWAGSSGFRVFTGVLEAGGTVAGILVPGGARFTRKDVDRLEAHAKEYGAKGLAWWKPGPEGGSGPLSKVCAGERGAALADAMGASEGDLCLFAAGPAPLARRVLGEVRTLLGRELGLARGGRAFLWVTEFPLFERDEATGALAALHHPFTAPVDWTLSGDPGALASRAYDLVLNGWELGSGSVRIHRADVQRRVFELLGIGVEEQRTKFGFLLDALAYGAPPHGGFALGLDRVVALTASLDNIRDVIAFPKTASATDLMCGAPSAVSPEQLAEVHVRTVEGGPTRERSR